METPHSDKQMRPRRECPSAKLHTLSTLDSFVSLEIAQHSRRRLLSKGEIVGTKRLNFYSQEPQKDAVQTLVFRASLVNETKNGYGTFL